MSTRTVKKVMTYGIIAATVLIGMTFVMSSSATAAVAAPGTAIVHPVIKAPLGRSNIAAPKPFATQPFGVAPRPFVRPFFNPFFPKVNPFFFNVDVNPFFFNEGIAVD